MYRGICGYVGICRDIQGDVGTSRDMVCGGIYGYAGIWYVWI